MTLNPSPLADGYESAWKKKSPAEIIVAKKEANELSQYFDKGQTAMKGVPSSASGISLLAESLANVWKAKLPDGILVGKKESIAIHQMVMQIKTSGGKHGTGGFMSGSCQLLGENLGRLHNSYPANERLAAIKRSRHIDTYFKEIMFLGTGIAPDFVPDISSMS